MKEFFFLLTTDSSGFCARVCLFFFEKAFSMPHVSQHCTAHIEHLNPYRTVCVGQRLAYSYLSSIVAKKVIVCFPMSVLKEINNLR